MRPLLLLLASLALAVPSAAAKLPKPPKSAEPSGCTIVGTAGNDFLFDSPGDDVICGLGGRDTLAGGLGDDTLVGGPGADSIEGGAGSDSLLGGLGNDTLRSWDGRRDRVDGGPGIDTAWVDPRLDRVKNVERLA